MTQQTEQTRARTVTSRVGIAVFVIGAIALVIGVISLLTWSQPDANIGAGLLIFTGALLVVIGLVVLVVSRFLARR